MKKYYYFSEDSLEFVEIKKFKAKFIFYLAIVCLFTTSFVFGGFYLITSATNSRGDLASLKNQNLILSDKLIELSDQYEILQYKLKDIKVVTENLRIAANLEPITDDEKLLGVGGGSFDNSLDFLNSPEKLNIDAAFNLIEQVTNEFKFEVLQYEEISKKIAENKKLFESIPAIMPTKSIYESSHFGMRIHPILKVRKMHAGIDFVANIGTLVYATGKGKVIYVGRRGSYGLEVVIDHGFGYRTTFSHLSKSLVRRGQKVERGDVIAKTGNSGLSTGPHLHYEVSHKGIKLNPSRFIFDDLDFIELLGKN